MNLEELVDKLWIEGEVGDATRDSFGVNAAALISAYSARLREENQRLRELFKGLDLQCQGYVLPRGFTCLDSEDPPDTWCAPCRARNALSKTPLEEKKPPV